ncbi:hypothetical protein DFM89_005452 [Clostridium beijerinckii]|nr:hypothetical protein [Clostridium beijerinckii]NRX29860.1 hypothetical protein [Clostridium beijerinckii]
MKATGIVRRIDDLGKSSNTKGNKENFKNKRRRSFRNFYR